MGCATPAYTIRQTPVPEESASALEIERAISRQQAQEFLQQGARPIGAVELVGGLPVQTIVTRVSRVTERPGLPYRTFFYQDHDPNAAALADGRIFISSGMAAYLAGRGSRTDELAFILGHELAHTVAQHLVKRYRTLQQQQLLMALVAAGASAATRNADPGVGRLVVDAASLLADVAASGYSQDQELEADQLGIRYVIRAGYNPQAALELLQDFARFDIAGPFLRTHPYIVERRAQLMRYLSEIGAVSGPLSPSLPKQVPDTAGRSKEDRREALRRAQRLYPEDSVSWRNLQQQLDELD